VRPEAPTWFRVFLQQGNRKDCPYIPVIDGDLVIPESKSRHMIFASGIDYFH
jgi:hypothetical protein